MCRNNIYPLYVLIPDDQCIRVEPSQRDIQWHERFDLEEEPTYAWDSRGDRYQLIWHDEVPHVRPKRLVADDVAAFAAAVKRYIESSRTMSLRTRQRLHYADPNMLNKLLISLHE